MGIDILNIIVIYYTSILEKINSININININKPFTVKYLVDLVLTILLLL